VTACKNLDTFFKKVTPDKYLDDKEKEMQGIIKNGDKENTNSHSNTLLNFVGKTVVVAPNDAILKTKQPKQPKKTSADKDGLEKRPAGRSKKDKNSSSELVEGSEKPKDKAPKEKGKPGRKSKSEKKSSSNDAEKVEAEAVTELVATSEVKWIN